MITEQTSIASAIAKTFTTFRPKQIVVEDIEPDAPQSNANKAKEGRGKGLDQTGFDLSELMAMDIPSPTFLCAPFIAEGLTICAGRPKIGKTTLIRQLLIAANTGSEFFSQQCEKTISLFLCLEEGQVLTRKKFMTMASIEDSKGIRIEFTWPRGVAGAIAIREYLRKHPNVRLIVIDSLSKFREHANKQVPQFQQDYNAISALQAIAKDFPGLCIVVLHHTTKATYDDPIDCISGTYGLTAACDSYGVILRKGEQFRLHWGGRLWDSDNCDFELIRSDGKWNLIKEWDFEGAGLPAVQKRIVDMLREEGAITTKFVASSLGVSAPTASEHLKKMSAAGVVKRRVEGWTLS